MSENVEEKIPESWYKKTPSKFVCLRCGKVFKRAYAAKNLLRRKKPRGTNMFSLWAWHNFRKHLMKCWGWNGNVEGESSYRLRQGTADGSE